MPVQNAEEYVRQHEEKQCTGARVADDHFRKYVEALTLIAGVRLALGGNDAAGRLLGVLSDGYLAAVCGGSSGTEWHYTVGDKVFRRIGSGKT